MAIEGFKKIDYENIGVRQIGIGVLGCGFIGQVHANAYIKIPYSCINPAAYPDLVALCDVAGVAEKAKKFRFKGYYDDWKKLVKDPRIDVIDICTPDNMHIEPSIAAAENGKHIICEKPLAMNVADAKEMVQAVEKANPAVVSIVVTKDVPIIERYFK